MKKETQNKWIKRILDLQLEDGSWGYFHSLSYPSKEQPLTTEQALRRLSVLGLDARDEPIRRALQYIEQCASGARTIPDRAEVKSDWNLFLNTVYATWLKILTPEHPLAVRTSRQWSKIIEETFSEGAFSQERYNKAYREILTPQGKKIDYFKSFVNFYPLTLLQGVLKEETENKMFDYILNEPSGIYYLGYPHAMAQLPELFESRETSRYLAGLELLAGYSVAPQKLAFAVEWLNRMCDENGEWDLGAASKDGIHFPLSDSWQKAETRRRDCTQRIVKLLDRLSVK